MYPGLSTNNFNQSTVHPSNQPQNTDPQGLPVYNGVNLNPFASTYNPYNNYPQPMSTGPIPPQPQATIPPGNLQNQTNPNVFIFGQSQPQANNIPQPPFSYAKRKEILDYSKKLFEHKKKLILIRLEQSRHNLSQPDFDVKPSQTPLEILTGMGFTQEQSLRALATTNNNVEQAAALLLSSEEVIISTPETLPPNITSPSPSSVELPEQMICVVCWENVRNSIFLPCGHICACWDCAVSVHKSGQCPICRVDIQSKWKVYYS